MNNLKQSLNELLSDLNIFFRKLQNYHWNVEGMDFFIIHEKLEEYYNEVNVSIDEIAEHILILGGQPLGTMEDYLNIFCHRSPCLLELTFIKLLQTGHSVKNSVYCDE